MLRTVNAARYVVPFREGGSVPALIEADDDGLYVVKLRGAAQGAKALVAELLAGELARVAGLRVPEIVLVELDRAFGDAEPDPEIAFALEKSAGLNLGLDYLPGSVTYDPAAGPRPDAETASRIVLFDAFVTNVDRTIRNTNLLVWHEHIRLIDHGAALYFHHGWTDAAPLEGSDDPFTLVESHVLLRWADALDEAAAHLRKVFVPAVFDAIVAEIPESWLDARGFADADAQRAAYRAWLTARLGHLDVIQKEAERARAALV